MKPEAGALLIKATYVAPDLLGRERLRVGARVSQHARRLVAHETYPFTILGRVDDARRLRRQMIAAELAALLAGADVTCELAVELLRRKKTGFLGLSAIGRSCGGRPDADHGRDEELNQFEFLRKTV